MKATGLGMGCETVRTKGLAHRLRHGRAGVTVMEAMLASVIMVMVITSVLAITGRCYRFLADIPPYAQVSQFLQEELEAVRMMSWNDVEVATGSFNNPRNIDARFAARADVSNYLTYSGAPAVRRVTLTATWTNAAGRVVTNHLTTLVSSGGLNSYYY